MLRSHTIFRLVGSIAPEETEGLMQCAKQHGVSLMVSGRVDDAVMMDVISNADVIACLRWPSLEAASASVIVAMLSGKATLVSNTRCYRDLPDDCVKKIDPLNEISSIKAALEHLYKNPDERHALGVSAKKWASQTFSATRYAEKIVEMSLLVTQDKPMLNAVKTFSGMMGRWGATQQLFNLQETIEPLRIFENRISNLYLNKEY